MSVTDIGMIKKSGLNEESGGVFAGFLLFAITSVIFWVIIYKLADWVIGLYFITFLLPSLVYAAFWGEPKGWSILSLVLYYLISLLVVLAKKL
jgi:hypothetical protein